MTSEPITKPRVADPSTPMEAVYLEAQKLAFAPLVFQACRVLRDLGALGLARTAGTRGITSAALASHASISSYAATLLLEAGLAAGLMHYEERPSGRTFIITKLGVYWNTDPLTRVNADFAHHVCYQGAFKLDEALRTGLPAGLPALSDAATVYEGLSRLDPEVRAAWFSFDHFYSDRVFEACIDEIPEDVVHLVDIGANTGRFSRLYAERRPARVTLVDLPGQLALARETTRASTAAERFAFHPTDWRKDDSSVPAGADVYWMSQFLDCFAEDEIVNILSRVRSAMSPDARLYIVETFWDKQRYEAARYSVIATSLYFACIANGNSRMYHSDDFRALVERAGLVVDLERHDKGMSHSLLRCRAA